MAEQQVVPNVEIRTAVRKLGLGAIIGIIFFSVSGGPYGLEDVVGSVGAGIAILLIIITPLISRSAEGILSWASAAILSISRRR